MKHTLNLNFFSLLTFIFLTLLSVVFASCEKNDEAKKEEDNLLEDSLYLDIPDLPVLGADYVYEGWVMVDGAPVSTGTFAHTSTNSATPVIAYNNAFHVGKEKLEKATAFILSVEPKVDSDPDPSSTKIIAGDFSSTDDTANLSLDHAAALGADFTTKLKATTVKYILATPTDNDVNITDSSGVWFLEMVDGSPTAGIVGLPNLPSGWKYEGWLVKNGNQTVTQDPPFPLTTGTFTTATGADDAAPYSGTQAAAPPFPGEDFLLNAPQGITFPYGITNKDAVVISVEPNPDDSPAPFGYKPFVGVISNDGTGSVLSGGAHLYEAVFLAGTVSGLPALDKGKAYRK